MKRSRPQVIVLLEDGLSTSESNFQFRLLLSRLYAKLGAFGQSMVHCEDLDIKHIQYDTMSHYWLTHAASQGHYQRATMLHNQALKFFSANFRDTSEYLIQVQWAEMCRKWGKACIVFQILCHAGGHTCTGLLAALGMAARRTSLLTKKMRNYISRT
jgi:hypothetical protein